MNVYYEAKGFIELAKKYFAEGNYFLATRYCDRSLEIVDTSDAHLLKGDILIKRCHKKRAVEEYKKGTVSRIQLREGSENKCSERVDCYKIVMYT